MPTNPRSAAYNEANRRLRVTHSDEFQQILAEEHQKRGLEPPTNRLASARKRLAELLTLYPQLRDELLDEAVQGES